MAIAFFSTWTTYGTWLPGDDRGWFRRRRGHQVPDPIRIVEARLRMSEDAVTLDPGQRALVEATIAEHCALRRWQLHAINCRTNHVHVLLTATGRPLVVPRQQFKMWCTRRLKERDARTPGREKWWTDCGWDVYIDDENDLAEAIEYIRDGQ